MRAGHERAAAAVAAAAAAEAARGEAEAAAAAAAARERAERGAADEAAAERLHAYEREAAERVREADRAAARACAPRANRLFIPLRCAPSRVQLVAPFRSVAAPLRPQAQGPKAGPQRQKRGARRCACVSALHGCRVR